MTAIRTERAWIARPWLGRTIRLASVIVPIALAVATGFVISDIFGRPASFGEALLRVVTTAVTSGIVMAAANRAARRFVPLAALLQFTLVFPDHAPSRFGIALRSGNSKRLERRIRDARDGIAIPDPNQSYYETLLELVGALDRHDRLTRGHCERTRAYTETIIKELDLPSGDADRLRWAALLHDIGKLGVDATILNKAERPTDDEWVQIRAHPDLGRVLAEPIADFLGPWMSAISQHHERWDGKGYPAGLAGHDIHLGGRIVAVADAYDVMTSSRSYKKAISPAAARQELVRCAGTQFDADVVRAFLTTSFGHSGAKIASLGSLVYLRDAFTLLWQSPVAVTVGGSVTSAVGSVGAVALAAGMVVTATVADAGQLVDTQPATELVVPAPVAIVPDPPGGGSSGGATASPRSQRLELTLANLSVPSGRRVQTAAVASAEADDALTEEQQEAAENATEDQAKADKDQQKAADKAAKDQAKAQNDQQKAADKAAKSDAKAADKAAKDQQKAADKAAKAEAKAAEKAAKDQQKAADKAAKAEAKHQH